MEKQNRSFSCVISFYSESLSIECFLGCTKTSRLSFAFKTIMPFSFSLAIDSSRFSFFNFTFCGIPRQFCQRIPIKCAVCEIEYYRLKIHFYAAGIAIRDDSARLIRIRHDNFAQYDYVIFHDTALWAVSLQRWRQNQQNALNVLEPFRSGMLVIKCDLRERNALLTKRYWNTKRDVDDRQQHTECVRCTTEFFSAFKFSERILLK